MLPRMVTPVGALEITSGAPQAGDSYIGGTGNEPFLLTFDIHY